MQFLKGIRVLDFGMAVFGPHSTYLLREMGAEVIHVGRIVTDPAEVKAADALYHHFVNFNKTNVGIDLKREEGRRLALRLAEKSDVAVENFRPGTLARLGLGPDDLRGANQRLIVVSGSVAGSRSALKVGYAPTFSALGGLADLTGYPDGPPVEVRHPVDTSSGVAMALSILVALLRRERGGGEGLFVDISARDVITWMVGHEALAAQAPVRGNRRGLEADPRCAPNNAFLCSDGEHVAVTVDGDGQWQALCDLAQLDGELRALGATRSGRVANRVRLEGAIQGWVAKLPARDVANQLQAAGVPGHEVLANDAAYKDPHLRSRACWHVSPTLEGAEVLCRPWRPAGEAGPAPEKGMDGQAAIDYVFSGLLGLPHGEIAELRSAGIIG